VTRRARQGGRDFFAQLFTVLQHDNMTGPSDQPDMGLVDPPGTVTTGGCGVSMFSATPPGVLWHLLHMSLVRRALAAVAILPLAGCFQSSTVIRVKADGSGTIEQRTLVTDAALDQLRAFAILGGGAAANAVDPTSEAQARSMAASIGPGVTYLSSTPVKINKAQGRDSIYAFTDIAQLRISEQPPVPGGVSLRAQGLNTDSEPITFAVTRQPDGNVLLRIMVPRPSVLPIPTGANGAPMPPSLEQIEMVKQVLAGARLTVAIEPEGRLVQTSSAFVDGNRVTLIDVDIDQAASDPDLVRKLQSPRTFEEAKAAINSVSGFKITLDPEISITFTPAK
jgi:hypothetical protein